MQKSITKRRLVIFGCVMLACALCATLCASPLYPQSVKVPRDDPAQSDLVELSDGSGATFLISKDQYRDQVLPYDLKDNWDDPDKLYATIVFAVQRGLASHTVEASGRLIEIDNLSQRSCLLRAGILLTTDKKDQAQALLDEYIRRHGPSGAVLLDLAKIYVAKKQVRKAEAALWKSLTLEPNVQETLEWWVTTHEAHQGRPGYVAALKKASAIKGSFRPQLYLAGSFLEKKDLGSAMKYIPLVLTRSRTSPEFGEVLTTVSGNLGENGYLEEMISMIVPLYVPEAHDPLTGFNLLQAYLEKKDYVSGMRLLNRLDSLNRADIGADLDAYRDKFTRLRVQPAHTESLRVSAQSLPPGPIAQDGKAPTGGVGQEKYTVPLIVDKPIWYYGLEDPTWLIPKKDKAVPIGILQFTLSAGSAPAMQESFARAIPLYLADSLYCQSNALVYVHILVDEVKRLVPNQGKQPEAPAQALEFFKDQKIRYLITGDIRGNGPRCQVSLSLWDAQTKARIKSFQRAGTFKALGSVIGKLENDLLDFCGAKKIVSEKQEVPFFSRLGPKEIPLCLAAYDKAFLMNFAARNRLAREYAADTQAVFDPVFAFALNKKKSQIPRITFLSTIALIQKAKPAGLEAYKKKIKLACAKIDKKSVFYRLSPMLYRALGMKEELSERKALLLKKADPAYKEWLKQIN